MITDVTVCDGGNHVTFHVDGVEWKTLDIEDLDPSRTHHQISQFMITQPEEDIERLYNIIIIIRQAQATTFEQMRTAVLGAGI